MGLAVAIVVGLAVVALLAVFASGATARRTGLRTQPTHSPDDDRVDTLRYRVPDAQDPAVLISALGTEGYTSSLDERAGDKHLVVACPTDRESERERVRDVIGRSAATSLEGPVTARGPVTFEDET